LGTGGGWCFHRKGDRAGAEVGGPGKALALWGAGKKGVPSDQRKPGKVIKQSTDQLS